MESSSIQQQNQQQLTCPQLPLAVYREVAAHLRQVQGIDASLILRSTNHNPTEKFDYYQSQVAALQISYAKNTEENARQKVTAILEYYGQRYRPWEAYTV